MPDNNTQRWNYFKDDEIVGLETELVAMLDKARHRSGVPYLITDGKRDGQGKQDRNAVNNSAHLTGHAVDLRCQTSNILFKMLDGLYFAGFKRIGVYYATDKNTGKSYPTHIHVDNDLTKPQDVFWITEEK